MKHKIIIPFLALVGATTVYPTFSFSQTNYIDSIRTLISIEKTDTSKVNLLNDLAWEFSNESPDSSITICNTALALSKKINWGKGIATTSGNMGVFHGMKSDYLNALNYFNVSLKANETIGNKHGMAKQLSNLGLVYTFQNNDLKALEYYFKALKISEEIKDETRIATILGNMGIIYDNQKNYSKALEYYFSALKSNKKLLALAIKENNTDAILKNKNSIARHLANIGLVYSNQADYEKALDYSFQALKLKEELNAKGLMTITLSNIGNIYKLQKKNLLAMEYYEKGLKIAEETGDKTGMLLCIGNSAYVLIAEKKYSEAEKKLKEALLLCKETGALLEEQNIEEYFTELYEKTNQPVLALAHYRKHIALRDSLNNEEKVKQQTQTEMQYEFDKKETLTKAEQDKKDAIATLDKKRQQVIMLMVFVVLTIVILFSIFVYRSLRTTRKQKSLIEEQKNIVEHQKHIVEEKQKEILDSIHYAKRIQKSLLPTEKYIEKSLKRLTKN